LRISGHIKVNEDDDSNEINIEDCNGDNNDKIEEENDNSD